MKYKNIFFISPPFYSHFNPLLMLARSLKKQGARVSFATSIDFKDKVEEEGLDYYELDISKNKNTTKEASQPIEEIKRLEEFFEATRKGPIETLITQSLHRKADMLYSPDELISNIKDIVSKIEVDVFVVDILSYSVTLSLYYLGLPFITFCPPHPNTIPGEGLHFNLPPNWPKPIKVKEDDLARLKEVSKKTQGEFTKVFNDVISKNPSLKLTDNAFSLVSNIGILYNYFDFNKIEDKDHTPRKIFMGNSFKEKTLDSTWLEILKTKDMKIMITLGTFLSNREDVLEKLIGWTREIYPKALIIVSAGANANSLRKYNTAKLIIRDFIPQIGLMPYMDLVVFHGGCNTLTEAIYYGKKILVLPFSSDQFNIAYDVEKNKLGFILDPNNLNKDDLEGAYRGLENLNIKDILYWSEFSKSSGPDYAAQIILSLK